MIKTKKAWIYNVFLLFIVLIFLSKGITILKTKQSNLPEYQFGEQQFSLITMFDDFYNQQSLYDLAITDSLKLAILEMAAKGGFFAEIGDEYEKTGCGNYYGYQYFQTGTDSLDVCFPSNHNIRKNLEEHFNGIFLLGHYSILKAQTENGFTNFILKSSQNYDLQISVRDESKIESTYSNSYDRSNKVSDDGLISPPNVNYYDASAFKSLKCPEKLNYDSETRDSSIYPSTCTYTPEGYFNVQNNLWSIESPEDYHLVIGNPKGNAMTKELANHLKNIGTLWYEEECCREELIGTDLICDSNCKAKIYISSISTGTHSQTSHHNIGNAADISRCYDKDGNVCYATGYYNSDTGECGDTFERCMDIIREYYKNNMDHGSGGTFIGPMPASCLTCNVNDFCLGNSCSGSESSKKSLTKSHYHHIHINPKRP